MWWMLDSSELAFSQIHSPDLVSSNTITLHLHSMASMRKALSFEPNVKVNVSVNLLD